MPLLAAGTLVLAGGGVFAATRPTWHPAPSSKATAVRSAAAGSGVSSAATAGKAHAAAPGASITRHRALSAPNPSNTLTQRSSSRAGSGSGHSRADRAAANGTAKPAITYTVKPGDTLYGIAQWFKLHGYGGLYAANRSIIGKDPSLIFPGERITISHAGVMSLRTATSQSSAS